MRTARVTRWDQLDSTIPYDIALYPGQLQLLRDHSTELMYVRSSGAGDDTDDRIATVSIALCPECGLWQLVDKQPPKRCQLKIGCLGEPIKVPAAPKASIPNPEDGRA